MTIYEYQFLVYVEADDERDAKEQVSDVSKAMNKLDVEGTAERTGPNEITPTEAAGIERRKNSAR